MFTWSLRIIEIKDSKINLYLHILSEIIKCKMIYNLQFNK